jgi:hypothetical protein
MPSFGHQCANTNVVTNVNNIASNANSINTINADSINNIDANCNNNVNSVNLKDHHNAIYTSKDFENRWKKDLKTVMERYLIIKQIQEYRYGNNNDSELSITNLIDELHSKTSILMTSPLISSNSFLQTFPLEKFSHDNSLCLDNSSDSDNSHLFDTQNAKIFFARLVNILGYYNKKTTSIGEPIREQDIENELSSLIYEESEEYDDYEDYDESATEEEDKPEPLNPNEYDTLLDLIKITESNNVSESICKDVCSICLDGYTLGDNVKKTVCNHYFHDDCLKIWFNSENGSIFCPVCRTSQR